MGVPVAVIRELMAAGLAGERLLAACERIEATMQAAQPIAVDAQAERRRAADRLRKAEKAAALRNSAESAESPAPKRPSELNSKPTEFNQNPTPLKPPRPDAGEALLLEAGVQAETIREWRLTRKAKRAGPITPLVAKGQIREAAAAGMTTEAATLICIERGWQAFRAEYVRNRQTGPPRSPSPRKGEGMAALDAFITELKDRTDDNRSESRANQAPVLRLAASC